MNRTAVSTERGFETRETDGNLYIEGYFAVYNSRYNLWDGAYETILPGAFDGQTDGDVRALINHDTGLVLGRTTAGTLELKADDKGLWGRILVNKNDQDAMNCYERVKRGDVSQCSFGFDITDQEIENGAETVWKIKAVKLYEVSVVTFPAYEDTSVEARKADFANIKKRETEVWREKMKNRLKGD